MDTVFLTGIRTELIIGLDAWHRPGKTQPVVVNLGLVPLDSLEAAANEDDVSLTLDYGKLYKSIIKSLQDQAFDSLQQLLLTIQGCLPAVRSSNVEVVLPKAILLAEGGLSITRKNTVSDDTAPTVHQHLEIRDIQCKCIVGVNPHERLEKQRLIFTISTDGISTPLATAVVAGVSLDTIATPAYVDAVKEVVERVESSSYLTVEALATAVAQIVTTNYGFDTATVRVEKPSAISPIDAAGVQVTRTRSYFENKDFWKVKRP